MKCNACEREHEALVGTITCSYKLLSGVEDSIECKLCSECYRCVVQAQLDEIRTIYREKNA